MKISQISIDNFRCLKSTIIKPGETCLLIGENDSGKTAILHALQMVFRKIRPLPDDLFTNDPSSPPKERDPFEIEVFLEPDDNIIGFTIDEQAIFTEHFDLDDDGKARLRIRMIYGWNEEDEEFRYTVKFQKNDGDEDDFSGRYSNRDSTSKTL